MIYLSGVTNDTIEPDLIRAGIGLMVQPGNSYRLRIPRFDVWAADNACYADRWDENAWTYWLASLPTERCLFAVSPDVYPDAAESLSRGLSWAPFIRGLGFPVAVVAQDGAETLEWPWDEMDCLFVGGERRAPAWSEWKESDAAAELCRRARNAGKWVHMGRVNTMRRLRRAREMGVQSVDGTYLKFGPNVNVVRLGRFLRVLHNTPPLFEQWETPSWPLHREMTR